jgi:L-asparaginase|tara:strand:- start:8261 stop:9271 length:1011 start_codon:yes stop_codon:yes gene_type:complete
MSSPKKPRIALIGTGGTISSISLTETDYVDYPETGRKLSVEEVITQVPILAEFADLVTIPFKEVGSSAIGPDDWLRLVTIIENTIAADPSIDGLVILHGTATIEETAWFLSLTLVVPQPVVLVGAQRPLNTVGSDAQSNAIAALRVAGDPQSIGRGVMVVLNDEIHHAREVAKGSTYRLHAFNSGAFGPLGVIDPDRVIYSRRSERQEMKTRVPFRVTMETQLPRVDILYASAGMDDTFVKASLAAGAKGIISAGFAPGLQSPIERAALVQASRGGTIVVQSTRVGSGRVSRRLWLTREGWIASDDLTPHKARILLMLALACNGSPEQIQHYFNTY